MTPRELLETLSHKGEEIGSVYNDGLDGWFGWEITFKADGRVELTVGLDDVDDVVAEETWILTPKRWVTATDSIASILSQIRTKH